jgi:preprotein translocase subunit SecB
MKEITNASFSLSTYRINEFSYKHEEENGKKIDLDFEPSGAYNSENGFFLLQFNFRAFYEGDGIEIVNVSLEADFKFNENIPFEEIPDFFYLNSIAIVFPYLRAFVSTLTSLANVRQVLLPVLNLSSLQGILKEHTVEIKGGN